MRKITIKMNVKSKQPKNVPNLRFPEFEEEWEKCVFSDIGTFFKGVGISKDQLTKEGTPCILYGELYTTYKNEVIKKVKSKTSTNTSGLVFSKANDVIIPSSGETAIDISTACCVMLDNVLLGGDLNIIRPKKHNGSFISYQLNGKRKFDIAKIAQGSSIIHLYNNSLKKIKINVPNNVKEEEKIVCLLSLLDDRISTQSQIIENLQSLMKGLSKKLFSQQLRFKDDNGKDYPNWEEKRLDELCTKAKSGGTPKSTVREYYEGEIPFLSISDMTRQGKYLFSTEKTISKQGLDNSTSWIVPINSIIYSMYASVGFVSINKIELATSQAVLNIIVKPNVNTEFLYYFLEYYRNFIDKYITTGTQGNLNAETVKSFNISIPSIKEQTKIANFLFAIDEKLETEKQILQKYTEQKKYLLANMFI